MKKFGWLVLALGLLPGDGSAQRGRAQQARSEVLEAQIFNRFMNRVSRDMRLNPEGRNRLQRYLRQSGGQRRALALETVQLRRRLMRATADPATPDAQIENLLQELAQLRAREQDLWNRDQNELASQLTPRQRAVFMLQWLAFNDRLRRVMQERDTLDVQSQ